ncbi:MAG: metal ABC transporter ATP-binding protein [Acidobacteriota bacterium]
MDDASRKTIAPERELLLRAIGLSASYGHRVVLKNVNLDVREGDFWFFLGPNGQGKTTLLRCLLGMLRPAGGEMWANPSLAGRDWIGFVPQRCDLNPTLPTTVREFVLLGLVGIRCNHAERTDRLHWALQKVGLASKLGADFWSLSGGQRQRALVARALVRRPRLLVLDEPTNGLDLTTEEALLAFLSDLNEADKITILFVTHDLAVAARHGTHFALFNDGGVITGPGELVLQGDNLERTYGLPVDISRSAAGIATVHLGARQVVA